MRFRNGLPTSPTAPTLRLPTTHPEKHFWVFQRHNDPPDLPSIPTTPTLRLPTAHPEKRFWVFERHNDLPDAPKLRLPTAHPEKRFWVFQRHNDLPDLPTAPRSDSRPPIPKNTFGFFNDTMTSRPSPASRRPRMRGQRAVRMCHRPSAHRFSYTRQPLTLSMCGETTLLIKEMAFRRQTVAMIRGRSIRLPTPGGRRNDRARSSGGKDGSHSL